MWNTLIPAPPHPEYTAAHATIAQATADVLAQMFGYNCSFDEQGNDALYGTRHYKPFAAYAKDAARVRVMAGIHYRQSCEAGLAQGHIVGALVNSLPFKKPK